MKVFFITLLLFSLTSHWCCLLIKCDEDSNSTDISSELEEIIGKARSSSCRYTRYGIDECKQFKENGMMIPIYPTLTFDPFSLEGFKLSIHKSISSANRIYSRTKIHLSDICELSGFNRVYKNFVDGTNSFSSFLKQDYATYFGSSLGISHECGIRAENYILLSSESSLNEWDDNFISALKLLPNEYNETIYSQFFNGYSPFIAIGSYGASFIRTYSKSENLGVVRFKAFDIVSGGNKSLFDISDTKLWIESILSNPTMVDFKIERMSQWINGLVSNQVVNNIIMKEKSLISQRPDSSFFEQVKKDNLPCLKVKISDLAIAGKIANYECPNGAQFSAYYRIYGFEKVATLANCDKLDEPTCNGGGTKVTSRYCGGIQSASLITLENEKKSFMKPLFYTWSSFDITYGKAFAREQVLTVDDVAGNTLLGYCSSVKYSGMVELNRFWCSTPNLEWGHLVLPYETYPNCAKEFTLCYVYPYGIGATSENFGKTREICAETFP